MADLAVVILAAGLGTRMKSATPKVFHGIAGRPMLAWVQETARGLSPQKLLTILGPEASETSDLGETDLGETLIQKERRGTGHAVQLAASRLAGFEGWVLVLYGDTALVQTQVLADMLTYGQDQGADLVVAGFRPADPGHYGRLIVEGGQVQAIVEYKDASPAQRQIALCNGGLMAFRAQRGLELLDQLSDQNAAGEFYLTDLVALMRAAGGKTCVYDFPAEDLMGVNTRAELAQVEALMQSRLRAQHMAAGVTFVDPASVTLAYDTKIGEIGRAHV